jgi:tape measure domain-containing protein
MAAEQNIIGEVGLLVKPVDPNAQFTAQVNRIIAQLEKQAQFQLKATGTEELQQQANAIGNAFAQASIQAAGLTAAVFGIRSAVEGTINKFSGLFDQLAQARAGFTSILKSETAGQGLLDDIREFARVSPFVTQELVNYSQQLLGVGVTAKQIIPLLKSTGDVISSVGGDTSRLGQVLFALTQIKSVGVLKGQDAYQLQSALIPITKYLADFLHKSNAEIVALREQGKITADTVFQAIEAQGEKVKGAMDKATRNITGARAILSDTVTILLQNQPVLNKVFENIYKSIITFANFLGTDEFQNAFERFFNGVDSIYEGLKPLFSALADIGKSGAITSLQVFGTVLETIGTVLQSIPQPAIEAFARLLAAVATVRAPLLIIQYAQSIQRIATGIVPAVTNLGKLTSATTQSATAAQYATKVYQNEAVAIDQLTAALTAQQRAYLGQQFAAQSAAAKAPAGGFLSRHAGGIAQAAILAGTVGGGILSQSNNPYAKIAGGGLTYAGIGAQLGLAAGPEGAVIGALAGGAFGVITGFLNKQKQEAQKWAKELKQIGEDGAKGFIDAIAQQFGEGANADSFKAYRDQIESLQRAVQRETDKRQATLASGNPLDNIKQLQLQSDAITLLQTQLDGVQKQSTSLFEPIQLGLKNLVEGLNEGSAAYNDLTRVGKGGIRTVTDDISKAEEIAKKYGFALEDIANPDKIEGLKTLIATFDGLTSAQQRATTEATKYNQLLDEAKKASSTIFDPQEKQIQARIDSVKAITEAEKAQLDFSGLNSDQTAKLLALKAQELTYAERLAYYQGLGYANTTATYRAAVEGEEEYQRLLEKRRGAQNNRAAINRLSAVNEADVANRNIGNRDINAEIAAAEKAQKDAAEKAQKDAEDAARKAQEWADTMKSAAESLADKLTSAASDIAAAAEQWVGSIKQRTQYEQAVSVGSATRNAQRQLKDLTEIAAGLATLRARGLSEEAIKSFGIDNVSDVKQVRKLLNAAPGDLTGLSNTIAQLNSKATDLATREEDQRTRNNITAGILDAAKTLGIDLTRDQAAAVGANFTITTISNADEVAQAIISALASGKISR